MRSLLKPTDYTSADAWMDECRHLPETWTYAGLKSEITNRNDWKKIDFFETSMFLQNNGNEIEAFSNYCPHRFSALRTSHKGNGIIRCPYHSWTFGAEGKCAGIPGNTDINKDEVRLHKWELNYCGEMIFVRRTSSGPPLRDWLGVYHDEIESISRSFGRKIDENRMKIRANWKIVIENTLENYHVATIHPDSFAKLGADSAELLTNGKHSSWFSALNEKTTKVAAILDRALASRPTKFNGYRHICVFPIMTIASAFGTSFAVQEIRPIAPDLTEFVSHVFFTKFDDVSEAMRQLSEEFARSIVTFNRQVFEEDKIICERVHSGTRVARNERGYFVPQELRVGHFQKALRETIGDHHDH